MVLLRKHFTIFGQEETLTITPLTLLVFFTILLRIPTLFEPYWYGDEGIYLTVGQGIRQGLLLYRDIFDHKPPAIYLVAALAESLFWFKFILLVWHSVTIVLFWKLAEDFLKKEKLVILASSLFALLTTLPFLEGNIANSELFILGPSMGAFLLLSNRQKVNLKRAFAAGLLFSLSILFKVPAVFDLFVIIGFYIFSIHSFSSAKKVFQFVLILLAGVTIPTVLSLVYFALQGALSAYVTTAWFDNFTYIARWGGQAGAGISLAGLPARATAAALVLGLLFLFRKHFTPAAQFVSIWLTLSLFAALISARPYSHYLIQTVPPLCLALTILALGKWKERFLPLPFLLFFFSAAVYYQFSYYPTLSYYKNFVQFVLHQKSKDDYFNSFDRRMPRVYQLASALKNRTENLDRVFIWGTAPEVYALSRRLPPGRYVTSFHITDFGGEEETMQALNKNKPVYIVVLPEETRNLANLPAFLQANYLYIESIEGAQFWKLMSPSLNNLLK